MVFPRFLSPISLIPKGLFLISICLPQALRADPGDSHGPKITAAEVLQYSEQHKAEWTAKITPGQQRLFLSQDGWPAIIARIDTATGPDARMKKLLFEEADKICASSMLVYHAPDPKVTFAMEEGWERTYGSDMVVLAFASKLQPHSKYEQRMHDMVLNACTFETWGRGGKNGELANMDLAAGSITKGISIAYDWHRDAFTETEKDTIRKVMGERVHALLLGLYGGIFWSNWYSQNHNHVSVAGMGLSGLAFYDEIPEAPLWLAAATLDFQRAAQSMASDGSSYEGVGYWGYGRAYLLEFIEGTRNVTGSDALYNSPSLKNAALFRIGSSTPDLKGILMWGDSRGFDTDGPHQILYRLAAQYQDGQAQYLADNLPALPTGGGNSVWCLLWRDASLKPVKPIALDYHFPDWDVASTRSGWGPGDYVLSLKSGQVNDHHTHLDVGSLIFYMGGDWLLMAPGYGLDAGKTGFFDQSGPRFNYFSNATESESTLLINGKGERTDDQAKGTIDHYISGPSTWWAEVDLSQTYNDAQEVRRRVFHRRGDYAVVLDEVKSTEPVTVDWLAQVPPRTHYEGPVASVEGGAGSLSIRLLDDTSSFTVRKPTVPIVDVSAKRLMTLSSEKQGDDVRFAVFLQPQFLNQASTQWKTSYTEDKNGAHVHIASEEGQDDIWVQTTASPLNFEGFDQTNNNQLEAGFLAVNQTAKKTRSITVGSANSGRLMPLTFKANHPIDFSLEQDTEGAFVLDLGTSFAGTLSLGAGLVLSDAEGSTIPISAGDVTLEKGRYFILQDATMAAKVSQWADHLFTGHADPRSYPLAKPSDLSPAPASAQISWEAEAAPLERYDYANIADAPKAMGGKALLGFGIDSPSDSVGWKINVQSEGTYFLKVRYATNQEGTDFALLVDGSLPSPDAKRASLLGMPGAPAEKYFVPTYFGWTEHFLMNAATGKPLVIPLTAGEHEIRLADPTEPLSFDSFELVPAQATEQVP